MQRFTDLKVWQRSHGLVSQLRKASASVPTNIAGGSKRRGKLEYDHFLNIAEGSLAESEYLLMLSKDLGFIATQICEGLLKEVSEIARMLDVLRVKVEASP